MSSFAYADDSWTTGDTVRQAAVTALLVVDWGQTRYISENPSKFTEYNHHFGESKASINRYFLTYAVGHAAVSYFLPRGWREAWQYIFVGIEGDAVVRNYNAGVKIQF